MIIFLHGPDTYRSRQKLNEIVERYKKANPIGLSLNFVDFKEKGFGDFKEMVEVVSMFNEKKLVVLKNLFGSSKDIQEKFLDYLDKLRKNEDRIVVVCEADKADKRTSLFKSLCRKPNMAQEFDLLGGQKLTQEIKNIFAGASSGKIGISPKAIEKLVIYVGNDLWRMSHEIDKVVSYKNGEMVEERDIELLVRPKITTDIFATIDALGARNKRAALRLIHRHLEAGDEPLYIFSMFVYQMRNLLSVKSLMEKSVPYYSLSKILKLHPFVIKKTFYQAQKFSLAEIKKIYQKLFKADLDIKTGRTEPRLALERLVMSV